ncbi:hypothetical protein [Patiriisocius sp. Uisw_017]|jgi:hypothetical protein
MAVEIDVMKEGKVKRTFESDKGNLAEVNLLGKKKHGDLSLEIDTWPCT